MVPKIVYDAECPVCRNYITMIRKKVSSELLNYVPANEKLNDFRYVDSLGNLYEGKSAIGKLTNDFPVILSYFWMLPDKYKGLAANVAYAVGSSARNVIKKATKSGCGCGK